MPVLPLFLALASAPLHVSETTPAIVRQQLAGQLEDLDWQLSLGTPGRPELSVTVTEEAFHIRLVIAGGTTYTRRLSGLGTGYAGAEGVALVVRGALEALALGEAPPDMQAQLPPAPRYWVAVRSRGTWMGAERPALGVELALRRRFGAWLQLGAVAGGSLSPGVLARGIEVRSQRLDLGFALRGLAHRLLFLELELGLSAWHRDAFSRTPSIEATASAWQLGPRATLAAGSSWRFGTTALELAVGLDVVGSRPEYELESEPLPSPEVVQPFVRLGVEFGLGG